MLAQAGIDDARRQFSRGLRACRSRCRDRRLHAGASASRSPGSALLVGFVLPYSYASYRRNKRFEKFEEHFPEAIDTLARAVRAGHAFTTALEMITDEVAEPVCTRVPPALRRTEIRHAGARRSA